MAHVQSEPSVTGASHVKATNGPSNELESLGRRLASEAPFASSEYILSCIRSVYMHRCSKLAEGLEAADQCMKLLSNAGRCERNIVLESPTFRSAVDCLLRHKQSGEEPDDARRCATQILDMHRQNLLQAYLDPTLRTSLLPETSLERVTIDTMVCQLWDGGGIDPGSQLLRHLFEGYEGARTKVRRATDIELVIFQRALAILAEVCPEILKSSLEHVQLVSVVGRLDETKPFPYGSFTVIDIPSSLFLSPTVMTSPLKAAEHLLHEALHEKWYDLRHTHSMMKRGYSPARSITIEVPWNSPASAEASCWPACRTVAAFHVYVYLTYFYKQAIQLATAKADAINNYLESEDLNECLERVAMRAGHLSNAILGLREELGPAGQKFTDWLSRRLEEMGPYAQSTHEATHWSSLYKTETTALSRIEDLAAMLETDPVLARQMLESEQTFIDAVSATIEDDHIHSVLPVRLTTARITCHTVHEHREATRRILEALSAKRPCLSENVREASRAMFLASGKTLAAYHMLSGVSHVGNKG